MELARGVLARRRAGSGLVRGVATPASPSGPYTATSIACMELVARRPTAGDDLVAGGGADRLHRCRRRPGPRTRRRASVPSKSTPMARYLRAMLARGSMRSQRRGSRRLGRSRRSGGRPVRRWRRTRSFSPTRPLAMQDSGQRVAGPAPPRPIADRQVVAGQDVAVDEELTETAREPASRPVSTFWRPIVRTTTR